MRFHILPLLTLVAVATSTISAQSGDAADDRAKLEQRLTEVERKLDRLLELLSDDPASEQVKETRTEIEAIAREVRANDQNNTQESQPAAEQAVSAEVVSRPPEFDASEEIINMPVSGYMDFHVNNDGLNPTTLDFHRFVLLFGHGFGDRIRFWSELELEHAFVEGGERSGELELEQAFLDFLIDPKLNFRAGIILAPVGLINERHEPPTFNGVERPFVDTFLIPTTWFGSGAGFVGDLGGGFSYKTYVMSSLDASEFSAEEGFREGRQKGFLENARNLAWTGRLEYRGVPGLHLGTSVWTGETGFNFRDINGRATFFEFDGRYRLNRFQARGQFVRTHLDDAAAINRALQQRRGTNPNIAKTMQGFYLEGGFSVLPLSVRHDLVPFYRYEDFNTQHDMPVGFLPLLQFDRTAHILGLTYYPYPDIAFKFDYNILDNASEVVSVPNRWNFGIGWWF